MDLGNLGPPQDVGHQDRCPKGVADEQGGTTVEERGDGDTLRAGGRRETAICLPWRLP